jgi:two-component system, cell cycle sensor histidine kinase and response regulator CckA
MSRPVSTSLGHPATHTPQRPPVRAPQHREASGSRLESAAGLASGVAHELNNILTAVLGFGTLLAEEVAHQPTAAAHAREIVQAGERAAALTSQLLAFCQRQILAPESVALPGTVAALRERLQTAVGPSVTLDLTGVSPAAVAFVDPSRLEEALVELARNAGQAMAGGGTFSLSARPLPPDARYPSGGVEFTASDTGTGIPAEIQSRIFDPFVTTRPRGRGLGLGLSVVYGFVKQSGGDIALTRTSDLGTTFTVSFPACPQPANVVPFRMAAPNRRPGAGETVLVVDDASSIRGLAAEALRRGGYRVLVASNASEAMYIATSSRGPIHVLLTDIVMPGSSGMDLAEELRTERRGLRVLYMSGDYGRLATCQATLRTGEGVVEKPFTADTLLQRVATLVT